MLPVDLLDSRVNGFRNEAVHVDGEFALRVRKDPSSRVRCVATLMILLLVVGLGVRSLGVVGGEPRGLLGGETAVG